MKRLVKSIQAYHRDKEKREQLLAEKKKRAVLQALRAQNEPEYRKLIAEAKDERLATLLKQTDDFLAQMGIMVQKEKDASGKEEDNEKKRRGS